MTTTPPPARTAREIADELWAEIYHEVRLFSATAEIDAIPSKIEAALLAARTSQQEELDRVRGEHAAQLLAIGLEREQDGKKYLKLFQAWEAAEASLARALSSRPVEAGTTETDRLRHIINDLLNVPWPIDEYNAGVCLVDVAHPAVDAAIPEALERPAAPPSPRPPATGEVTR